MKGLEGETKWGNKNGRTQISVQIPPLGRGCAAFLRRVVTADRTEQELVPQCLCVSSLCMFEY